MYKKVASILLLGLFLVSTVIVSMAWKEMGLSLVLLEEVKENSTSEEETEEVNLAFYLNKSLVSDRFNISKVALSLQFYYSSPFYYDGSFVSDPFSPPEETPLHS